MVIMIFVGQDTAGFIVNRLLVPYIMESIKLVERGTCGITVLHVGSLLDLILLTF